MDSTVIQAAVPCAGCGYNLQGLTSDGRCPECGREIGPSLSARYLHHDPASARSLRHAIQFLIAVTLVGVVGGVLLQFLAFSIFRWPWANKIFCFSDPATRLLLLVAAWWITRAPAVREPPLLPYALRSALALATGFCCLMYSLAYWLIKMVLLFQTIEHLFIFTQSMIWSGAIMALFDWVGIFLLGSMLVRVSRRLPNRRLAGQWQIATVLFGFVLAIPLISSADQIWMFSSTPMKRDLLNRTLNIAIYWVGSGGMLVLSVWSFVLFRVLLRDLKRIGAMKAH